MESTQQQPQTDQQSPPNYELLQQSLQQQSQYRPPTPPIPNETPRGPQIIQAKPTLFPYFAAGFAAMITRDIWRPILPAKVAPVIGILFAVPLYYHLSVKKFEKMHEREVAEYEKLPAQPFELPRAGAGIFSKAPYPLFPKIEEPKPVTSESSSSNVRTNKWGDEISE